MDSPYAQVDDDRMGLPERRYTARRALGLCSPRLGWLLGLGSCRKRFAYALAYRHRISPFRDDAGETGHDEGVECLAGFLHVFALYPWYIPHAQRRGKFGPRFRAIFNWALVCGVHHRRLARVHLGVFYESRLSAQQQPSGFDGLARIKFPV